LHHGLDACATFFDARGGTGFRPAVGSGALYAARQASVL